MIASEDILEAKQPLKYFFQYSDCRLTARQEFARQTKLVLNISLYLPAHMPALAATI